MRATCTLAVLFATACAQPAPRDSVMRVARPARAPAMDTAMARRLCLPSDSVRAPGEGCVLRDQRALPRQRFPVP